MNIIEELQSKIKLKIPKVWKVLKIISIIVVIKKIIKFLIAIYKLTLRKRLNFKQRYGQNSWAFITGSSQGIGKAFAQSLANQGFNIILCARTLTKLQKAKEQIITKHPQIKVQILQLDFKRVLDEQYFMNKLKQICDFDISILVNNVGVDVLAPYTNLPQQQILDLIKINCIPVTILNHHFISIFKERLRKFNKKSAIINVASMAGQIPMPLHNVYSASKAYVDFLSRALSYEYKQIDIISFNPSQVSTPMTLNKQTDILTITAKQCAQGLLNNLGYQRKTNGFWTHQLQGWIYSGIPQSVFNYFWLNYIGPDFIKERQLSMQKCKNKQKQIMKERMN